jgi:hydroxylamine dehydrogenase
MACHRIGSKQSDGSTGSCNFCHPAHTFDLRLASDPQACTQCHTGHDYPQDLAYRLSKHGALHSVSPDASTAPTCATCHQPDGRHDDSFGITLGGSGAGAVLAGTRTAFPVRAIASQEFALRRSEMVAVCTRCHSSRLAEASLRQADELKREGEAHLLEAAEILRGLAADGYFGAGQPLALGPQYARPDPGSPGAAVLERFYQMWRFDHAGAWKGAYHQSPSVANHESGAGTREDLDFIRAEAQRWRARGANR